MILTMRIYVGMQIYKIYSCICTCIMSVMYFSRYKNGHIDQTIHSEITAHFNFFFILSCGFKMCFEQNLHNQKKKE